MLPDHNEVQEVWSSDILCDGFLYVSYFGYMVIRL